MFGVLEELFGGWGRVCLHGVVVVDVVAVGIGARHASISIMTSITTSSSIITSTTLDQMNRLIRINNPIFQTSIMIIIQNPPFMNKPLPISRTIS